MNCEVKRVTLPRAAPAAKRWGRSHHQHPSRAARRYAGREGDTRGVASLRFVRNGRGKSVLSRVLMRRFVKSLSPQRRGLRPLRKTLWLRKS